MAEVFDELYELLRQGNARFRVVEHVAEGKSEDVARIRGTTPGQGAKAMLCKPKKGTGGLVLAVLPGNKRLDMQKLATAMSWGKATLANPDEATQATRCVIGAIPPFSLNDLIHLVVDPGLIQAHEEIAFNAGSLERSMVLDSQDYVRIAKPRLVSISTEAIA